MAVRVVGPPMSIPVEITVARIIVMEATMGTGRMSKHSA
jgi:hypothetical protein